MYHAVGFTEEEKKQAMALACKINPNAQGCAKKSPNYWFYGLVAVVGYFVYRKMKNRG